MGIQASSGTVSAADCQAALRQCEVYPADPANRAKALEKALEDDATRAIMEVFLRKGWTPLVADAEVGQTEHEGKSWYTVVLPFDDGDPTQDEQTYILWSDSPTYAEPATGQHIIHREPADSEAYWDITEYWVEGGEVVSENRELLNFLGCPNPNWGCILITAGEYAAVIGSCYACGQSAGWLVPACAACISAVLTTEGTILMCDYCKG